MLFFPPLAGKYCRVQIAGCRKVPPGTNYRLRKNTARYKLPVAEKYCQIQIAGCRLRGID